MKELVNKIGFNRWLKINALGLGPMWSMLYWQIESRAFTGSVVCSHLWSEQISLHKWFASSLPPTARQPEWLGNYYFLSSLITKNININIYNTDECTGEEAGHMCLRSTSGTEADDLIGASAPVTSHCDPQQYLVGFNLGLLCSHRGHDLLLSLI